MITLTLNDGSRWAVPAAHITGVWQHPHSATVTTVAGDGETVRETFDEVLALYGAAMAPAPSVDREAVALAARVLHAFADGPDDLWPTVRRMLGIGQDPDWAKLTDSLRTLAYRLGTP